MGADSGKEGNIDVFFKEVTVVILHRYAATTQATHRLIQTSGKSVGEIARDLGAGKNTVQKWKKYDFVEDLPMGRRNQRSMVLSRPEEAACVAFRRLTLLPLHDCPYTFREVMPHLLRSAVHHCFQRHNVSRLPKEETKQARKGKFGEHGISFFHIGIAEV